MSVPAECPDCHNDTMVVRASHTYCAYCGYGRRDEIHTESRSPAQVEEEALPDEIAPPPKPIQYVQKGVAKLGVIHRDLMDLAEEFNFEIPERVHQIFEMAAEIIRKRGPQDDVEKTSS